MNATRGVSFKNSIPTVLKLTLSNAYVHHRTAQTKAIGFNMYGNAYGCGRGPAQRNATCGILFQFRYPIRGAIQFATSAYDITHPPMYAWNYFY